MKRRWIWWILALLPYCLCAQQDAKAAELLDKLIAPLMNGGVRTEFKGTENGALLLKGEKFYLHSGNVQSWYDGNTQWSYMPDTEEVNISHPTPEELQAVNPYFLLLRYKSDYHYAYKGITKRNGVEAHEIVLTPRSADTREVIRLFITKEHRPLSILLERNGRTVSDINVTAFQTRQQLEDGMFRFDKTLYPKAEIIDLR